VGRTLRGVARVRPEQYRDGRFPPSQRSDLLPRKPIGSSPSCRWWSPEGPRLQRSRVRGTKADPVEGEHLLYSFLTSKPNGVVAPIHPKAMPVILTTQEEYEIWLNAPDEEALKLQRPLPDNMLKIVAERKRSDQPEAA
jgi:hypothetical protein